MKYSLSLPPLNGTHRLVWKEQEQTAIILDLEATQRISKIQTTFHKNLLFKKLPDAVYFHSRKGRYQVYGLTSYDYCSGIMTFYGKTWRDRPQEMSKSLPSGAEARSFCYLPNQKAVVVLNNGVITVIDRYQAKIKSTIVCPAASVVFAGQTIYIIKGRFIHEHSPRGYLLNRFTTPLGWALTINSGAVNCLDDTILVGNKKGQLAILDKKSGAVLCEGVFDDGGSAGFRIVGFNGENLLVSSDQTQKIYWLDLHFKEVTSVSFSTIIPEQSFLAFDGRDILALSKKNGTLYTYNIQDNWEYAGIAYTAAKRNMGCLPPKILNLNNIFILYCEYPWDLEKIKTTIGYLDNNKKAVEVMFDGLLLMAQTYHNKSLMGGSPPAGLPEWIGYLDHLMSKGGIYELAHLAAEDVQLEANLPTFHPKVFIGIPYPMDSLERYQWFIDQCLQRSTSYPNLVLAGFYYTEEFTPDSICHAVKNYIHTRGLKYIWSPGYPAKRSIKRNTDLFDAIFYQTGYPWGYFSSKKGKEHQLSLAMNNMTQYHLHPNVECMNDTRWFTFIRDKAYALWDMMLNYGIRQTTRLHFAGTGLIPESCFSKNPYERQFYDTYHQFLRGNRPVGLANPVRKNSRDYHVSLPHSILADKIRIMPRFTQNPPAKRLRTLELKSINIITEDST